MATVIHAPETYRQIPVESEGRGKGAVPDRLVSLDAFRGFIMTALVAHGFGLATLQEHPTLGWLGRQFEHVAWEGMVFWDLIQPAFMFMVGLAMPFAFEARRRKLGEGAVWQHVAYRALMLIVISQLIMSISRGEAHFQLINVLSQIGFAYFLAFLVMQLPLRSQFVAGGVILAAHTALFHLFPGADGAWSQTDNIGARIDHFFGLEYGGFYVTINFLSSTVTTLFGVWCGYLMLEKNAHERRVKILAAAIAACWIGAVALSLFNPMVKRLWTASFTLASAGCVMLMLLAFYWMVEMKGWRRATFPLVVVGMNSIFIYCVHIVLWGGINRAVGVFTGNFEFLGEIAAPIAQASAVFAVLWYLCYWLYQRRIFIRI
jgi:predicted acyltransferase